MSAGKPLSTAKYDLMNANGLAVYMYKGAQSQPDGIKIFLNADPYEINWLRISGLVYAKTDLG